MRAFTGAPTLVERLPFYDPDVVVDARGFQAAVSYGWGGLLELPHLWDVTAALHDLALAEPPYLSADGALLRTGAPLEDSVVDLAWTLTVGPGGVTRQSFAGSVWGLVKFVGLEPDSAEYARCCGFGADVLPGRYLRAWTSGDPKAVATLYAGDAVVRDTLAGTVLAGRAGIEAAVTRAAHDEAVAPWRLRGARLYRMPDGRGESAFTNGWWLAAPLDRLVLIVDAELATGCRGHVAAVLDITAGLVTRDERFYRVDDARRCLSGRGLPDGWWSRVPIPSTLPITHVSVPGREATTVWNGNPAADALLRWGYGRFAQAGLPPPAVEWVRVVAADPAVCLSGPRRPLDPMLAVCDRGGGLPPTGQARAAVLHGLAHHWLDARAPQHPVCWAVVTKPGQRGCVRPVTDEAAERAADVIAWGLMDQPWLPPHFGGTAAGSAHPEPDLQPLRTPASLCRSLTEQFRLLTGAAPLQRCGDVDRG